MTSLTGLIGFPVQGLKNMLADSAAFRQWTGTGDAVAAAAFVTALISAPRDGKCAVISLNGGNWSASRDAVGGGVAAFAVTRELALTFSDDYTPVDDDGNISPADVIAFQNSVDAIIADLLTLADTGAYLNISALSLLRSPFVGEDRARIYEEFSVRPGL